MAPHPPHWLAQRMQLHSYNEVIGELEPSHSAERGFLTHLRFIMLVLLLYAHAFPLPYVSGWLSPGDPDPAGQRMKLLQWELMGLPNIMALFFECVRFHSNIATPHT